MDFFGATIARIPGRCAIRQSVKVWYIHDIFPAHFSMDARESCTVLFPCMVNWASWPFLLACSLNWPIFTWIFQLLSCPWDFIRQRWTV
jgi:hypothetical protein